MWEGEKLIVFLPNFYFTLGLSKKEKNYFLNN